MTVNRYATQAGKRYEKDLWTFLTERGYETERLRLAGKEDEGDLWVKSGDGKRVCIIEAKRTKALDLAGWIKEAHTERLNYATHRKIQGFAPNFPGFVVIHYAKGKGIENSYVTTTLNEWLGTSL